MIQSRSALTASTALHRTAYRATWLLSALAAIAWNLVAGASHSETQLPPPDGDVADVRLQQHGADAPWLLTRVLQTSLDAHNDVALSQPKDSAAAEPLQPSVDSGTEEPARDVQLDDIVRRIDALEELHSAADLPEQKNADVGWVDVSTEKWTIKLGGHVQLDYITWADADPAIDGADNYFSYRRLRLVADGTGYGQFDFRLQMTLEPGLGAADNVTASPDVKDAYLSMNEIPWIGRVRIGNFFVPFSLEQVTNDTNNIFNERSIPTQGIFAADREVGIAFYNHSADENVTWASGFFFDDINDTFKTRFDDNQGYRLSGRLTWLPYYDEPSQGRYLVHTGVGLLYTHDQDGLVRFRSRPQIQRGPVLIDSGAILADAYTTGNVELAIVWGRVTVQSEAFLSSVDRTAGGAEEISGAYVHVSWFLTGEHRIFERFGQHGAQFGRNQPFTNFFATAGGVGSGAWEAKARWSNLNLSHLDSGEYNDLTVGFNWYWSDRTRIMFDWIHPVTSNQSVVGSTNSDLIAMRFDFNW